MPTHPWALVEVLREHQYRANPDIDGYLEARRLASAEHRDVDITVRRMSISAGASTIAETSGTGSSGQPMETTGA
ncbi:unnamed protein product, partial [Oppiella nova]